MTPLDEARERLKWWIKEHGSKEPDLVKDVQQVLWALDKAMHPENDVVVVPIMDTDSPRGMPVGRLDLTASFAEFLAKALVMNQGLVFGGSVSFDEHGLPKLLTLSLAGVQCIMPKLEITERSKSNP